MSDYVQGHCHGERLVQGKIEDGLSYSNHLSGAEEIKIRLRKIQKRLREIKNCEGVFVHTPPQKGKTRQTYQLDELHSLPSPCDNQLIVNVKL